MSIEVEDGGMGQETFEAMAKLYFATSEGKSEEDRNDIFRGLVHVATASSGASKVSSSVENVAEKSKPPRKRKSGFARAIGLICGFGE